ncbi:hypothetical protein [Methyloversatilis sp.]|uniref:hypothetical protein n=1 Tax=Methyloversatilis sp. TaxID=2569862 RepID=UPI0035AEB655
MAKKISVAEFLEQRINMCGKSQKEIADEMGYEKPNIITMFKQGKTRLPINKVYDAAVALEVEPMTLLRLALSEYMPETWAVIEQVIGNSIVTEEEQEILSLVRSNSGGLPLKPETEEEILEFKNMVRAWKKRSDAHADAARRRVEATPKNKRGS